METIKIEDLNKENMQELKRINFYVPVEEKIKVLELILNNSTEYVNGVVKMDRVAVKISLSIMRLPLYLNVLIKTSSFDAYNRIQIFGLEGLIDEDELMEWNELLENMIKNIYENNTYKNIYANVLNEFSKKIEPVLENVNNFLDKGDPNKIAKYLSVGLEKIANYLEKNND